MSVAVAAALLRSGALGEAATQLQRGAVSACELADAALAAVSAHNAAISAVRWLNPHALDEARALDAERNVRGVRGPLHGLPVVVKDNIDMAGVPTTCGAGALAGAVARADAEQVRRLKAAGAVILAKTNLSEFSFDIRSRSTLGGDVRNPFNTDVTAGGSSGGTAAAVAAGFALAGLGTDTGGSIRIPASFNGLVGLRPTQGLIDIRGVAPLAPTTDTVGPMARSVADIGLLLGVMADGVGADPAPPAARLDGVRIGVLRAFFGEDEAVVGACHAALAALGDAGAVLVEPVELPAALMPHGRPNVVDWEFGLAFEAYLAGLILPPGAPSSLAALCQADGLLESQRETFRRRCGVRSLEHDAYRAILAYHGQLRAALSQIMQREGLSALVYPTAPVVPTSLDKPQGVWAPELAACTGWPALTLPVGQAENSVPIGLEFLGPRRSEARLIGLAAALERRLDRRFVPELG